MVLLCFAVQPFARPARTRRAGSFLIGLGVHMRRSFTTHTDPAYGSDGQRAAIGLDVMDAVYHTAHSYPGGVPALAQRMAVSENTLAHKVSINNTTHHLTLREAVTMQEMTGDARILQAMAGALGYVCVSLRSIQCGTTLEQVMHMAKEFGEVLASVNDAVADGRVTPNEMQDCERQAAELTASLNAVLGKVRSMMRAAPEAF